VTTYQGNMLEQTARSRV